MLQVVCCCPVYQSQVPSTVCFFKHCDLHWAILTIGPRSNPVTSVVHQTKERNHAISMFNKNHTFSVMYIHSLVHFLWSSLSSLKRTLDYSYTEIMECLIYLKNQINISVACYSWLTSKEIGSCSAEISSRLRPFGGRYLPYVATRPTIEF